MKSYSASEVARHKSIDSLWVIHKDKVYDVTEFVKRHPGGEDVLLDNAGQNVSEIMSSIAPHQHSSAAYQILQKYYIGELRKDHEEVRRKVE